MKCQSTVRTLPYLLIVLHGARPALDLGNWSTTFTVILHMQDKGAVYTNRYNLERSSERTPKQVLHYPLIVSIP